MDEETVMPWASLGVGASGMPNKVVTQGSRGS
jgi:hypothetical protein